MTDVFFFEAFAEEEKALRKALPREIRGRFNAQTIQETRLKKIPAEIISIRTQSLIPPSWANQLKGVMTRSSGYDHIIRFRRDSGIKVPCGHLSDYCSRSVAEQAVLLSMALLRKLKSQQKKFATFDRNGLTGADIHNKNVLVFGVGHIGQQVVELVRGLKANVKGVDIKETVKDLAYVPLAEGIRWADIIICCALLDKGTDGALTYELLRQAKQGCVLVNVSRGEITPLADLEKLLKDNILGGLAMDVFPDEAKLAETMRSAKKKLGAAGETIRRLAKMDNVIFTPHNAFNTQESVERKARETVRSLVSFIKSGKFPDPVPEA